MTASEDYLHHGSPVWFGQYICPLNHKPIYRAGQKIKAITLSLEWYNEFYLANHIRNGEINDEIRGEINGEINEKINGTKIIIPKMAR